MQNKKPKIFTNKMITAATFLGGPLAAGFLISKNYRVFGKDNAARNSLLIGIISTIILFVGIFSIPDYIIEKIPNAIIPGLYTLLTAGLVKWLQGEDIKNFLSNEGEKASNWTAAGFGFLGLAIIGVFLVILFFSLPLEGYEKNIKIENNIILHYSKDIKDDHSKEIARFLKQSGYTQDAGEADILLNIKNNFYCLRFVIQDTAVLHDTFNISAFNEFEKLLNENVELDKRIEIFFTDVNLTKDFELPDFNIFEAKPYIKIKEPEVYHINENHTIFHTKNISTEDILKVEKALKGLKNYFPIDKKINLEFHYNEMNYTIKFFVLKELWEDQDVIFRLSSTRDYIKLNGIDKEIDLVFVDNQINEQKLIY